MDWARPAWPTGRPKQLLSTVALVMALVSSGAGFDEYTACMRPAARVPSGRSHFSSSGENDYLAGRPSPTPPPPCDFRKQSWCAVPGSGYPWHAVRQFVHENQGLMRRMYGEVRQISVLQAELSSNEVTEFDLKSTGRADGSEGFDFDLHALREAAVVKYTAAMPVKSKGVKVRKGGAKRGGESGPGNKMVDSVLKVADSGSKGGDSVSMLKVDDAWLKEGGSKTQSIHTSTDKGGKVPISTAAELDETIWQSEYSSFELPTTVVSTLSPDSSSPFPGENIDGSQVESSSKMYDQDMPNIFETTTVDAPGSTHINREISSPIYKESSMTPEATYTTTPYPQFNFFAPVVISSTTPDPLSSSPYEKATVAKVEEFHQEKLFQDVVKEEKEGGEELIHEMMGDDGMLMATNTSVYDEGLDMRDEEESEEDTALKGGEDDFMNAEGEDEELVGYPSGTKVPPPAKLRGVNACPVKEEVVAPFWANNTRGEILALLNLYPFEQYVHWEKCTYEHRQMFCREGCRCEQQYRLHRLLAYDPRNECRGIFSDWFKFPSCCVCMCYNIPSELRHTSRSPRNQHEIGSTETSVSEEESTFEDKHLEKNERSSSENSSVAEENIEVRLLGENFNENEPGARVIKPEVPSISASDSGSVGTVPVVTPLHFYYYYNQHQTNPQPSTEKEDEIPKLPLQNSAHLVRDSVAVDT